MKRLGGFDHGESLHSTPGTLLTCCRDFAMVTFSATVTLALEVQKSPEQNVQLVRAIADSEKVLERVQSDNKLARDALSILHELQNPGKPPSRRPA
jgi:hypothetical protein